MKNIGLIDIGTNSIRLSVEQVDGGHNVTPLMVHREAVRLGEGEFGHNMITRSAMERGLLVLRKFAEIARRSEVSDILAVATAALREAGNRGEFVERARDKCGVDVRVISGLEEARLIHLGVASGVDLDVEKALFGRYRRWHDRADSRQCNRASLAREFQGGGGASRRCIPARRDRAHKQEKIPDHDHYVMGAAGLAFSRVRRQGPDAAFGSSGTIVNLAEITAKRLGYTAASIRNYSLSRSDLADTILMLCELDLERRRSVPGINPDRADIIVSGAAILDAVMGAAGSRASGSATADSGTGC